MHPFRRAVVISICCGDSLSELTLSTPHCEVSVYVVWYMCGPLKKNLSPNEMAL